MKFINKERQDILEVLNYQDGPCVYGFEQKDETFLALKVEEDNESNQTWIFCPLTVKDKHFYDQMKNNEISLKDFLKNKSGYLVKFDFEGSQQSEKRLSSIPEKFIKTYEIAG